MDKKDLRIVKSKLAIKNAFLELMKEKGYANITITDIADRAMINRKTFYSHYETKENLYYSLIDELINALTDEMAFNYLSELEGPEQRKAVTFVLNNIKEHREVFNVFINDDANHEFTKRLKAKLTHDLMSKRHIDAKTKGTVFTTDLLIEAYFTLFMVIIQWWINTDNVSTDQVIEMILQFFSRKPLELLGIDFTNYKG